VGSGYPDLMQLLVNVGALVGPLIGLIQAIAGLMGFYLVGMGLLTFWELANENSQKGMTAQSTPPSAAGAVARVLIGGILVGTATLEMVGILSRSFVGEMANIQLMSYVSTGGSTLADQAVMARQALFGIMQVVGFIAIIKGWWTLNERFNARTNASMGVAVAWLIGGVLCWNFQKFAQMLNNTIGFDLLGMLFGS
jgi:intracellular multiplication protein IcmC